MRLDGWKSIGSYFGRERSTVIRWAADRGMPVHRIPGSGRGSVFALTEELDAWLESDSAPAEEALDPETEAAQDAAPTSPTSPTPITPPIPIAPAASGLRPWLTGIFSRRGLGLAAIILVAVASLGAYAFTLNAPASPRADLPADARAADLYLEARSDWAARQPASIEAAIEKLQQVVDIDPGFAPAYAALADCYLLAREFGSQTDTVAFARAQLATDAALRIDQELPAALRAKGFIEYWWHRNGPSAAKYFQRSLALAPQSAQTHFWYGNVLIDNGDMAAGLSQLDAARLLEPASVTIQTDIAWARWSAGDEAAALRALESLRARQTGLATVRDYLSVIYLAKGDLLRFTEENLAQARIRKEVDFLAQAERLVAAHKADPSSVLPRLLDETLREAQSGDRTTLVWPSFVASAHGDRAGLLRLLAQAEARNERWGSAGLVRHMRERWTDDRAVLDALDRRRSPPMISDTTPK